jgi:hypothetical protein
MVHMADFPAFWTAIAEDGFYEEVISYSSFSPLYSLHLDGVTYPPSPSSCLSALLCSLIRI